jgi:hypothetical protein
MAYRVQHGGIAHYCCRVQDSGDSLDLLLAEWLDKIRILEHVLVPAEQLFDFVLGQRGQSVKAVAGELSRRWHGAFGHLDPARFLDVVPAIDEATAESDTSARLRIIASCTW